jgi:uncharacterized membrane protein
MNEKINLLFKEESNNLLTLRQQMETTRNLSTLIVAAMAIITFAFSDTSQLVLFLGSLSVFALLIFESRIFRDYDNSLKKIHFIQTNYIFAVKNAEHPNEKFYFEEFKLISFAEAFAVRIYKNYLIIFFALDACWFSKLYLFPVAADGWSEFVKRAELGFVPGTLILGVVAIVWITYIVLIIWLKKKYKGKEIPN